MKIPLLGTVLMLLALTTVTPAYAAERSGIEVKAAALRDLQELRNENTKRLREIDQTMNRKIEEGGANLEKEVGDLRDTRREYMARLEFLNRLIFQVDTKFGGGDLRAFLERSLTDMAKVDAVSSNAETGLWKFMKYTADALRRLPEQKENILSFIEGYMTRSVTNPIRPEEYLSTRNYTNGAKSEEGSPLGRDEVGAIADRRLQELTEAPRPQMPAPQQIEKDKSLPGAQELPADQRIR